MQSKEMSSIVFHNCLEIKDAPVFYKIAQIFFIFKEYKLLQNYDHI